MTALSGIPYAVLMIAFGIGIWITAGGRRAQRITAAVLIGEVVWGFVGGLAFPMATREAVAAGGDRAAARAVSRRAEAGAGPVPAGRPERWEHHEDYR